MNVVCYNADEILKTAIEIEKNAAEFYREAADSTRRLSTLQDLFSNLATMEQEHARIFVEMRGKLSDREKEIQVYDPGNEMLFYLQGMAGIHAWEGKAGPGVRLTGDESAGQILATAVAAEKDTVFFYEFLRDYVPEHKGPDIVGRIIKEEMRHVSLLNRELSRMEQL